MNRHKSSHPKKHSKLSGKRNDKGNRLPILSIGIIIGLFVLIIYLFQTYSNNNLSDTRRTSAKQLSVQTVWLIDKSDLDKEIQLQTAIEKKLTNCLDDFKGSDSRVLRLRDTFVKNFYITHFVPPGVSRSVSLSPMNNPATQDLEVVIYGSYMRSHPRIASLFFYDGDWRALFIPALDVSYQWFCAISIHELQHALNQKVLNAPGASALFLSDAWIKEELDAHQLESVVLNQATKGKYLNEIDLIIKRKSGSFENFLQSLSFNDLQKLNMLFQPASELELQVRLAQFLFDLSMRYLENKNDPELLREKIDGYRMLYQISRVR